MGSDVSKAHFQYGGLLSSQATMLKHAAASAKFASRGPRRTKACTAKEHAAVAVLHARTSPALVLCVLSVCIAFEDLRIGHQHVHMVQ